LEQVLLLEQQLQQELHQQFLILEHPLQVQVVLVTQVVVEIVQALVLMGFRLLLVVVR
jgi:hypothetical protein